MNTYILILVLAAGSVALKVTGPLLAGGAKPPPRAERVIGLLMPALLSALVASGTFSEGRQLELEPRAAGVTVGAVMLALRLPLPAALALGALTAAVLRAVT